MVVLIGMFISLFLSFVQREITRKDCTVILTPCFFITDQNFDSCREELPPPPPSCSSSFSPSPSSSSSSSSSSSQNLSLSVCLSLFPSFHIFVLIFKFLRQESIYYSPKVGYEYGLKRAKTFFLVQCKLIKHQLKRLADFYRPKLTRKVCFTDNLRKSLQRTE